MSEQNIVARVEGEDMIIATQYDYSKEFKIVDRPTSGILPVFCGIPSLSEGSVFTFTYSPTEADAEDLKLVASSNNYIELACLKAGESIKIRVTRDIPDMWYATSDCFGPDVPVEVPAKERQCIDVKIVDIDGVERCFIAQFVAVIGPTSSFVVKV